MNLAAAYVGSHKYKQKTYYWTYANFTPHNIRLQRKLPYGTKISVEMDAYVPYGNYNTNVNNVCIVTDNVDQDHYYWNFLSLF